MTKIRKSLFNVGNRDEISMNFLCFPKKRENVAAANQVYRISLRDNANI